MANNPPPSSCTNGTIYTVQPGDSLFSIANKFGITVNQLILANPQLSNPNVLFPGDQLCIPKQVTPSCPGGTIYQVQAGDTLTFIAQKFGVSVNAIIAANPQIVDPNVIFPGQLLCIPGPGTTTTPTPPPSTQCPTLTVGSTGPDVIRLQSLLLANGFSPGPIDGIFGAMTLQAVINFQVSRGLVPDGIVGVQTWTALGVNCAAPPPVCPGFIYTVQPGDTLSAIAARFGTTVNAILAVNPQITNPNVIFVGQKICIPTGPTIPPVCPGFIYTVQPGDTLSSIAARFGTTVNAILAVNPQITNPNVIFVGQKICIPTGPTTTPPVSPCPTLSVGSTGPSVVQLQTLLLAHGFSPGPIDGIFGPLTESAVISFQRANGLVVDGIVGVQTWTALGVNCATTPPSCPGFIYTVQPGDTLSAIAARFGTTVNAILAVNPQITNPNVIFVGQRICIPT